MFKIQVASLKAAAVAATLLFAGPALAAEGHGPQIPDAGFSFARLFGTYDRAAAQRGFQVYKEVCSNCHSMRQMYYRNLTELGLSADQVRNIAASFQITDGPNDEGAMFERAGRVSDHFRRPFPNDNAARSANGGALPPDLSVITKARENGANYLYALLTGYRDAPAGVTVMEGMHYNEYFPGHQIAMGPPLSDGQVDFGAGVPNTVEAMARDVTTFMAWASEPELETRRAMGVKILIFLSILGVLAYLTKRRIWADAH
ncbi:cytochrome c1 [Roseococcus pinisoli]|uniref:Cytochrome c1 n=1 Tax=Roseococcus pinisoli TaxID=2835040 RepID=A0ABS5QD76_9PROT|nr:cytochrome c1 [Roseococcus pinisoli]MBS7811343.1 cytochrome c1 [Roseococcus pinisoli]